MVVNSVIEIVSKATPDNAIEILASEIEEREKDLEILKELHKELMMEAGDGFITAMGRMVVKRTRTTNVIDGEIFFMTDKEKYMKFAEEGKLTVPASCIKELDTDSPYISQKVAEFYTLKGDKNN